MRCILFLAALTMQAALSFAADTSTLEGNMDTIRSQYLEDGAKLIKSFPGTEAESDRVKIIYTLGELRFVGAIGLLIDNIKVGIVGAERGGLAPYGSEPAATALAKIGSPSVHQIIATIRVGLDNESAEILCNVLIDVLGAETAKFTLQRAARGIDNDESQRLAKCIDQIDRFLTMQQRRNK